MIITAFVLEMNLLSMESETCMLRIIRQSKEVLSEESSKILRSSVTLELSECYLIRFVSCIQYDNILMERSFHNHRYFSEVFRIFLLKNTVSIFGSPKKSHKNVCFFLFSAFLDRIQGNFLWSTKKSFAESFINNFFNLFFFLTGRDTDGGYQIVVLILMHFMNFVVLRILLMIKLLFRLLWPFTMYDSFLFELVSPQFCKIFRVE